MTTAHDLIESLNEITTDNVLQKRHQRIYER